MRMQPICSFFDSFTHRHNIYLPSSIDTMRKAVGGFTFSAGARPVPKRAEEASSSAAAAAAVPDTATKSASKAARPDKRLRMEEGFKPEVDIESCWPTTDDSDHVRLLRFLDEAAQRHVKHVRSSHGSTNPQVEAAVSSLYNGFLASCRQYVADDAKSALLATNPKNEANKSKETALTSQITKYKEELRQWESLSKAYGSSAAAAGDDVDEDDGLDEDTLKRFGLASQIDGAVGSAVSSTVVEVDKVTEAVRGVKRQLRIARAGTAAVSSQARGAAFAGLPTGKDALKAVLGSAASSSSTAPTMGIIASPPTLLNKISQRSAAVAAAAAAATGGGK